MIEQTETETILTGVAPPVAVPTAPLAPFLHQPTDDTVVLLPDEAEKVTGGGIILPEQYREPLTGRVLALGPGLPATHPRHSKPFYDVGDRILFGKYAGQQLDLMHGGRKVILLRFEDVRLVLR